MEAESKQELMKLAILHYNAGNYEVALETYKKVLTIDPIDLRANHGIARSLASLHRCKEALEEFDSVLNYDGLSNDWYCELYKQRGDVYFELQVSGNLRGKAMFYDDVLQNFLHALDDYDRALTLNRKNEEAARMKAQAKEYYLQQRENLGDDGDLFELTFYDERFGYTAYKKLKEASLLGRTNDGSAFSKTKEQWLQEGINHYLAEDYTNSLRACELAIQLDANYARAYYGKGLTLRRVGNDQEALKAFDKAIQLDPAYMKAYFGMGNSFFKLWRYEEALAAFDKAIEIDPGYYDHYVEKGLKLLDLKRDEEAIAIFDQAIHTNPHDFSVYSLAADLLAYCDHCEKGLAIYDQAISLNLNSASAYVGKGHIFQYDLHRNDDALAAYEQAALLDPDCIIIKASFLFEIDRYEEAANAYSQIIKHHPNDPVAHYMKGESNLFTGRNEEALASFEQVLQLDPNDVITQYKKGKALFGCGRYEEALATFKKTISLFEDTSISSSLYNSFYGINSKYDNSRYSGYKGKSLGEIYADICKKFSGLAACRRERSRDLARC